MDSLLKHHSPFTSEKDETSIAEMQFEHFQQMRALQKKLAIDDDTLLAGTNSRGDRQAIKNQIAEYERFILTIEKPISINGVTFQPGTKLRWISRDRGDVHIFYNKSEWVLPVSVTDLRE